jgi:hypothetical protein
MEVLELHPKVIRAEMEDARVKAETASGKFNLNLNGVDH